MLLVIVIFLETIQIVHGIKNPIIIMEQNYFTVHEKLDGRTRWRCINYFKTKCRARLLTYGKVVKVNAHAHNHGPPPEKHPVGAKTQYVQLIRETEPNKTLQVS